MCSNFGQSCTVKVEETGAGLLVTWEDVPVSVGSDNVAYIGARTSFQLFWSTSGEISFLYSEAAPSSSQASIGLVDGPETDDFVATDFLALPRGDAPVTGPLIVFQPLDQSPPFYYPVQFQVRAVGQGTIHYKWFENGVEVPGQASDFYSSFTQPASGTADYVVEITDDNGTITSRVARYTVVPEVSVQLTDVNLQEGAGPTTLRFERQGVTTNELTVFFDVSGTVTPSEDLWVSPQGGLNGTVTFPSGQSTVDVSLTALDWTKVKRRFQFSSSPRAPMRSVFRCRTPWNSPTMIRIQTSEPICSILGRQRIPVLLDRPGRALT